MKQLLVCSLVCLSLSAVAQGNLPGNLSTAPLKLYPSSPYSYSGTITVTGSPVSISATAYYDYPPLTFPLPAIDQPAVRVVGNTYYLDWTGAQTARQPSRIWLEIRAAQTVVRVGYLYFVREINPGATGTLGTINIATLTRSDINQIRDSLAAAVDGSVAAAASNAATATTQAGIASAKAAEALSSKTSAADSQTKAAGSATSAAGSASAALSDRQAAQTARSGSETARDGSVNAATSAGQSAQQSQDYSTSSQGYSTSAAGSATSAGNSATNAAASAAQALATYNAMLTIPLAFSNLTGIPSYLSSSALNAKLETSLYATNRINDRADVSNHTGNTNNPHNTTAAQVGAPDLASFNTALTGKLGVNKVTTTAQVTGTPTVLQVFEVPSGDTNTGGKAFYFLDSTGQKHIILTAPIN
ncbi:hypothetical protein [Fibrella forsythiae]|uniref:Uncharacterized protein n=1 Tax=Fibrella forsythiae TaxID=2817061 RepID=A0ABS3JF21_9BACT|nr:hypothetical protein [Fibrella forsythiae]MBO0947492.1 hypothetical protein [Fibrella forsythiae]